MPETYGIQLGVGFNFEEAKQNLNQIVNELQKDYKINLNFNNVNFDKIINDYKNLQQQLQSNEIKLNTNGFKQISQDLDKVSTKMKQVGDSFVPVKNVKEWSNGVGEVVKLTERLDAETGKVIDKYKDVSVNASKIRQSQQQANDIARKLSYQEEQNRLKITTDTQKKIEQAITGSNETIAQQQTRITRNNGQQYEQFWLKALKEREQKAVETENKIAEAEEKRTQKMIANEQKRVQKLGQQKGFASSGMFSDDTYIKSQIQAIYGADASIKNYKRTLDSAGNSQVKMTVATQGTNNRVREFGVTVDKNTQKIYQNGEAIKVNNQQISTAFERMGNSIKQMASMALTVGLVYKAFSKAKEATDFMVRLDQQMVQVREISGMTQEQTDKLANSYSKISVNLATTLTDMSKLTVELTRQGLAIDETNKRVVVFSKFNKVINGDINQSTELMTAGINSLQVDAQELSDTLVKVGAVSGTSAVEVGQIIQKSGAMAKEGKVSLQELATMGAIISEKTRESGETIGTSLKTIFAKFQQVKKDTGEVNKDFSQTINTLEKFGVKTGVMAGQLRPVGEILQELASKWNDMNDKQRAMVSSSLGVYQISRFSALMQGLAKDVNGVSRSQQIYDEVMKANGETNKQYEVYLNSLSGALDKFKAKWEVMFNNSMSSNGLKSIVNMGTGILNVIDKIGGLRFALISLNTILLLSSSRFKTLKNSMFTLNVDGSKLSQMILINGKSLQQLKLAFTSASASGGMFRGMLNVLKVGLTSLKVKAMSAKIAIEGLKMALTMGLSIGISLAIEGIMKLINKSSELKQKNEELQQSVQQNLKSNNDMIRYLQTEGKEYDTLSKKTKLTTEEQEKLKNIKQQLAEKFPELVQGINSETGELELQKKSTKELIDLLKQKNQIENQKLVNSGNDMLKEQQNEYAKLKKKYTQLQHQAEMIKNGGGNLDKNGVHYRHTIEGLQQIQRNIGLTKVQQEELNRKTEEYRDKIGEMKTTSTEMISKLQAVKPNIDAVFSLKKVDAFTKKLAEAKIDFNKFIDKDNKLDFTSLQVEIQQFKDKIENDINYSNIKMVVELKDPQQSDLKKYFDNILALSKTLKMSPLELTKIMPLKVDKAYLQKHSDLFVKVLKDEIKKASGQNKIDLTNMIKMFDGSQIAKEGNKVATSIGNIEERQKALDDAYKNSIQSMKEYTGYLKEMKENGHLSAESLAEIINKHAELIPYLNDEKTLYKKLEGVVNEEKQNALNAIRAKLEANSTFCMNIFNQHRTAFQNISSAYGVDLENFKSIAVTKQKINEILTRNIGNQWIQQAGMGIVGMKNAMKKMEGSMRGQFLSWKSGELDATGQAELAKSMEDIKHLQGYINALEIMEKDINSVKNKISNAKWSSGDISSIGSRGHSSKGSGRSSSGSKSKYSTDNTKYSFAGQALNAIDGIIKTINDSIEQTDKNIESITQKIANLQSLESKSNFKDIIDQENKKLEQQRIKVNKLQSAQKQANEKSKQIQLEIWKHWSIMKDKDLSQLTAHQWDKIYNKLYGKEINFGGGKKAEQWKDKYDKGAKLFQEMRKDYENTRELFNKSAQDELKMEQEINATIKERVEIQKASYDEQLRLEQKTADLAQANLDIFNIYEKDHIDYLKKSQLTSDVITQQKSYLIRLVSIRNEITKQKNTLQKNTLEWNLLNSLAEEYNDKIGESNKNLQQSIQNLDEIREAQLNELSNMQEKIVNALKKRYEEELKLAKEKKAKELLLAKNLTEEQLKLIKNGSKTALEIFEEEHQKKIDLLNEELKSYEEIYNAKIREIDDKESEDKYSTELNKKQQDKSKLQAQHDELLMDSSLEAKAKRVSLLEDIKKKQEEIDDFQHNRDITLRKQNLKDTLDAQRKKIQNKIDEENKAYKKAKDLYDKEVKALEEANKDKLKSEKLYAKAREMLMQNSYDELNKLLVKYGDDSERIFGVMGKTIKEQICDNLKYAIDLMQNFNTLSDKNKWQKAVGYNKDYIIADHNKPKEMTYFGDRNRGIYNWDDISKDKEYNDLTNEFLNAKRDGDKEKIDNIRKKMNGIVGKYKKHKDGGLNVSTGFHWLDGSDTKPELVLNADQTQAMLGIKDYLPKALQYIQQPKIELPKINLPQMHMNKQQPIIQIEKLLNVEGSIDKTVLPKVEHASNDLLSRMKKEFNQLGIYRNPI